MSNYTKTTNFAVKDSLASGDTNKVVRGTELNAEYDNLAIAIATKLDTASTAYAKSGANSDITSLNNLTTPLSIAQGGSGFNTGFTSKIQSIASSVAANALTVNYNGGVLDFRSPTATLGTPTTISVGSNNIVVPSTATLGTVSGVQARLALLEVNNGGLNVACIVNLAGGLQLDETNLISPTTISTGANSASVIYSNVAVGANIAYRIVGYIDITEATAGTWATAATAVQGNGGQALAALSNLGYGQTWQNVAGSRAVLTTYTNTTGKPITLNIALTGGSTYVTRLTLGGTAGAVTFDGAAFNGAGGQSGCICIIPNGGTYSATINSGTPSIVSWLELR